MNPPLGAQKFSFLMAGIIDKGAGFHYNQKYQNWKARNRESLGNAPAKWMRFLVLGFPGHRRALSYLP
jgi:hypothetical protein